MPLYGWATRATQLPQYEIEPELLVQEEQLILVEDPQGCQGVGS